MNRPINTWFLVFAAALLGLWLGCVAMPGGSRPLYVAHTNATGQVTYTLNPGITNAAAHLRDVTDLIPTPWSTVAQSAMAVAIGVLGWVAKRKSDRAAIVPTLIAGVEASPHNDDVKTTIRRVAEQTGMEKRLNRAVRRYKSARTRRDFGKEP
jgi:hypothetical protein